jgi:hypothetical protein
LRQLPRTGYGQGWEIRHETIKQEVYMGVVDGVAGISLVFSDIAAVTGFIAAVWIALLAAINLGTEFTLRATANWYLAFWICVPSGILGLVTLAITGQHPTTIGILGQPPSFTLITLGCAIALYLIHIALNREKCRQYYY